MAKGPGRNKGIKFSNIFKRFSIRKREVLPRKNRIIESMIRDGGKVTQHKRVQTTIPVISPGRKKILKLLSGRVKDSLGGKLPTLETVAAASTTLVGATGTAMTAVSNVPALDKVGKVLAFVGFGLAIPSTILAIKKSIKDKRTAGKRRLSEIRIQQLQNSAKESKLIDKKILKELKNIRETLKIKDVTPETFAEGLFVMHNVNPKYLEGTIQEVEQIQREAKNIPTAFAKKLARTASTVKEAAKAAGIPIIGKKQKYMASPMKNILYGEETIKQIMTSKDPALSLFSLALAARGAMEPLSKSTLIKSKRK